VSFLRRHLLIGSTDLEMNQVSYGFFHGRLIRIFERRKANSITMATSPHGKRNDFIGSSCIVHLV
jgi:hypothetical protein